MLKLKPISYKNLVKGLKSFGFNGPYPGGKHQFMIKEDKRLIIPNPHRNEISVDLLIRILKQAEIKREDWIKITQDN
jgi:predicted RNA binding protein YcfA (HicA-like mRNA interferase family)